MGTTGLGSLKPECHLTPNSSARPLAEVTSSPWEQVPSTSWATSLCSGGCCIQGCRRDTCPPQVTTLRPGHSPEAGAAPLLAVLPTVGSAHGQFKVIP